MFLSFIEFVCIFQHLFIEDDSSFSCKCTIVDHIHRSFIAKIFWNVVTWRFLLLQKSHVLIAGRYQFRTEVCSIFFIFRVIELYFFRGEQFSKGNAVFFVKIYLDELLYFLLEVIRFLLHFKSSPVNAFDILEPLVPDELTPHGQTDPWPSIGLKNTNSVSFVPEDHPNMIALRIGEESLNFGKGVVVFEEQNITSLAISVELSNSTISFLKIAIKIRPSSWDPATLWREVWRTGLDFLQWNF